MPRSQRERIHDLVDDHIQKLKFTDAVTTDVSGPQLIRGPRGVEEGWQILVTIKHNLLLGQPPIGVSIGVFGLLPPDSVFQQVGATLLEKAREERHRQETVPAPDPDGAIVGEVLGRDDVRPLTG